MTKIFGRGDQKLQSFFAQNFPQSWGHTIWRLQSFTTMILVVRLGFLMIRLLVILWVYFVLSFRLYDQNFLVVRDQDISRVIKITCPAIRILVMLWLKISPKLCLLPLKFFSRSRLEVWSCNQDFGSNVKIDYWALFWDSFHFLGLGPKQISKIFLNIFI